MSLIKSIGNKKVNLDFNKNFITTFSDKINFGDLQFINQTLKDLHPSDVANLIENLSYETRVKLIEIESFDLAPEIFIEINESIQSEVLLLLSIDSISNIIKRLESDDAVSILENLDLNKKNLIFSFLRSDHPSFNHGKSHRYQLCLRKSSWTSRSRNLRVHQNS